MFGAVNASTTPYKGYNYLIEALEILTIEYNLNNAIEAVVFGSNTGIERVADYIDIHYLGFLNEEEMVDAYNCADIYIVPSLEDSFNNTVIESLACETPVVAFATGGIKDIIDHKENGYLAKYADAKDLARGIYWILKNGDVDLGKNGREKINKTYSYKIIAHQYKDLYKKVLR